MPTLDLEVIACDAPYWRVQVEGLDIVATETKGSIELPPGRHLLVWRMTGKVGDVIKIAGTRREDGKVVVLVDEENETPDPFEAGHKRFTI